MSLKVFRTQNDGTSPILIDTIVPSDPFAQTPSGQSFEDIGLIDGTNYGYIIESVGADGTIASISTGAATPLLPPSNLQSTSIGTNEIDIAWTNNSLLTPPPVVNVQRDGVTIGSVDSESTFDDTTVGDGRSYTYAVIARPNGINSDPSNSITITTPVSAPYGLHVTGVQPGEVDLAWNETSSVSPAFLIERTGGMGGPVTLPWQSGDAFQDTTAIDGTIYTYTVIADYNGNTSLPCSTTAITPLAAPSGLAANAVATNEIDLT